MAINVSLVQDEDAGSTTASFAFVTSDVFLMAVAVNSITVPTGITQTDVTWVKLGDISGAVGDRNMSLWRGDPTTSGSGTAAITGATGPSFVLAKLTGAGATLQSKTARGGNNTLTLTLDNSITPGSATFGAGLRRSSSCCMYLGSGYSQIGSQVGSSHYRLLEWKQAGTQLVNATQDGSVDWMLVGAEIENIAGTDARLARQDAEVLMEVGDVGARLARQDAEVLMEIEGVDARLGRQSIEVLYNATPPLSDNSYNRKMHRFRR